MKKIGWLDLAFILTALAYSFYPPFDPDLGWQLRCGQVWWQGGGFCQINQFTTLLFGFRWVNHAWLYQVFLDLIFDRAGVIGLSFFCAVVVGLTMTTMYFSINSPRWWRLLWVGFFYLVAGSIFSMGIRSQLLGLLFFGIQLLVWRRVKRRFLAGVTWILSMWLWVNFHGSFGLGLVAGAFLFGEEIARSRRWKWGLCWLAGVGTTLINPFGVGVYRQAWSHLHGVELNKLIAEWVAPVGAVWWLSLICGLITITYLLVANRGRRAYVGVSVFLFLILALSARRHVPFLWIWCGFWLFGQSSDWGRINKRMSISNRRMLSWLILAVFMGGGWLFRLPREVVKLKNYETMVCAAYPCKAVEFIKQFGDKGAIFNRYEWGGYLVWKMPERLFFVDGRMPAWSLDGKSPYSIYLEILQNQLGWQKKLDDYDIKWILISPNTFMDLLLRPDPAKYGWEEKFRDEISVAYLRVDAQTGRLH